MWDEVRGMRVSHVESFDDNAQDLKDFMGYIKRRDENAAQAAIAVAEKPHLCGQLHGGPPGLLHPALLQRPPSCRRRGEGSTSNKLFSKLLLMAPCIEPYGLGVPLVYVLHFALGDARPVALPDIFVLAAMDVDNNHLSHDLTFLNFWDDLRHAGSRWLIVYGPSLNFLRSWSMRDTGP